jgi:carboxyl-terminal processing protease
MRSTPSSLAGLRRSLIAVVLLLALSAPVGPYTMSRAELTGPQANDRQVTLVVTSLLRREHLSKLPLDDKMSQRGLDLFIKNLDPGKLYFYQSDVDEFAKERDNLDDQVKKGDISFAYTVFNRLLERIDERVAQVDELLGIEHDFTVDEELLADRDKLAFPRDADEMRERWRKRIKYDLLVLKSDKIEGQDAIDRLHRRYHSFAKRMHQTDSDELLEIYLTSITSGFDPHTTYMSPTSLENFRIQMRLELEGIGAALQSMDGNTTVTRIIPGGAADKDGNLKEEDRIVAVGQGTEGEMVDVLDMKLNDVVDMIRGKAGTIVRLKVIPAAGTEANTYTITRAKIELKDSEAHSAIFEQGTKPDGSPIRVGVIDLPSFYMDMEGARQGVADFRSTTRDMQKLLADFRDKGVDLVILDLRKNGGGSLTEAINLTGLFIDKGPVVQVKDPDGAVQHYDDLDAGMAWDGPLVVMTSKFSASASEIFAGAIQDYHRGLVVGDETTHGKGTVQSLLDLGSQLFRIPNPPNFGALKITMQQFYRPSGDSTQKRGVLADVVLPSVTTHMDVGEADLDYAMDFDRVPAAKYEPLSMVTPDIVVALRARSAARREQSEGFQKLLKRIDRYKEQKARKAVPLNEEKFFADRGDLDAEKEEQKQFEEQQNGDGESIQRNYYLDEVIAMSLDYYNVLHGGKIAQATPPADSEIERSP